MDGAHYKHYVTVSTVYTACSVHRPSVQRCLVVTFVIVLCEVHTSDMCSTCLNSTWSLLQGGHSCE